MTSTTKTERMVSTRMRGGEPQFLVHPDSENHVTGIIKDIGYRITNRGYYRGPEGSAVITLNDEISIELDGPLCQTLVAHGYDVGPDW